MQRASCRNEKLSNVSCRAAALADDTREDSSCRKSDSICTTALRSTLSSNSLHRCYVAPSPSLNLALRIVSRSLPLSHVLVISARRPALRSPMLPAPFPARAARENEVENSRGWEESKRPRLGDRNSRRKTRVQRSIKPAEADEEMGGGEKLAR